MLKLASTTLDDFCEPVSSFWVRLQLDDLHYHIQYSRKAGYALHIPM